MRLFPTISVPDSTPEVVQRCQNAAKIGYLLTLVWLVGASVLLYFGSLADRGYELFVFGMVFITFSEKSGRAAQLHKRIIELKQDNENLRRTFASEAKGGDAELE